MWWIPYVSQKDPFQVYNTLLLKNHQWFPITFNIFSLCLILILFQVHQFLGSVGWWLTSALETSQAIVSSDIYSFFLFLPSSLPPSPSLYSPSLPLSFLFSLLSPHSSLLDPNHAYLKPFTSFCSSQMRAKDLSSGKISEICLYSTARSPASWTLGDPSLPYSLAAHFLVHREFLFALPSHFHALGDLLQPCLPVFSL